VPGIFKVIVIVGGIDQIDNVDAIEYEGAVWLVPVWIEQPASGLQKPARIIRVDQPEQAPTSTGARYFLSKPVPKALFDCSVAPPKDSGFEVRDLPPILLNADGTPSDQGVTVILSPSPDKLQ
jgi:hypothetical protein